MSRGSRSLRSVVQNSVLIVLALASVAAAAYLLGARGRSGGPAGGLPLPTGQSVIVAESTMQVWDPLPSPVRLGDRTARRGGTLRIAVTKVEPATHPALAPQNALDSETDFGFWFQPLILKHGETDIPFLAERWNVHDGVYLIREAAKWSDGEPVIAEDFVLTFSLAKSGAGRLANLGLASLLSNVQAIDDKTLKLVAQESNNSTAARNLFPTPSHAWSSLDAQGGSTGNALPQCGPYGNAVIRGETLTYQRNSAWWGYSDPTFDGTLNSDTLVFIGTGSPGNAVLDGLADLAGPLSRQDWSGLRQRVDASGGELRALKVMSNEETGAFGIMLNTSRGPLASRPFRQALQHCFDFDKLSRDVFKGEYTRAKSYYETSKFADTSLKPYPFDLQRARDLVKESGFTIYGNEGIWTNARGERAEVRVIIGPGMKFAIEDFVANVRSVGIFVRLQEVSGAENWEALLSRNYEICSVGIGGKQTPDRFHSSLAHSHTADNMWAVSSPQFDALADSFSAASTDEERVVIGKKVDRLIWEEAFFIPLWYDPTSRLLVRRGLSVPGMPEFDDKKLWMSMWWDESCPDAPIIQWQ